MINPPSNQTNSWTFEITRVLVMTIAYAAAIWFGMKNSFFYGGGFTGFAPFLTAVLGGPWAAAWVACRILPSRRPRVLPSLALGIYAGLALWLIFAACFSALLPNWPVTDPRARFVAQHDFSLAFVPLCIFVFLTPLLFARWIGRRPLQKLSKNEEN